jgi:DNA-binding NtrC family response regulator
VDVRFVATTTGSLAEAAREGKFREDLLLELGVLSLRVPPLRERAEDIELLAYEMCDERSERSARQVTRIAVDALSILERYPWPGNERELDNAIEHVFVMGEGPVLEADHLPPQLREGSEAPAFAAREGRPAVNRPAPLVPESLSAEGRRIWNALERSDGHRGRAAASLGMSRVTLWRKMRKHGLAP